VKPIEKPRLLLPGETLKQAIKRRVAEDWITRKDAETLDRKWGIKPFRKGG
jgi:hypothetical protein